MNSQDYWYELMFRAVEEGDVGRWGEFKQRMLEHLRLEVPTMASVVFERWCNLMHSCKHCIYPPERSSAAQSRAVPFTEILRSIARQIPTDPFATDGGAPRLLHEGRVLRPWHVEAMAAMQDARSDLRLALVDNGTFVRHIDSFQRLGVRPAGISISLDGTEAVHNAQRDPTGTAFAVAIEGMKQARQITDEVNCAYTITSINAHDVEATAELVLGEQPGSQLPLANAIDITTMSPVRADLEQYECSTEDMRAVWEQLVRLSAKWNSDEESRVFFRLYRHGDFEKLAHAIGADRFWAAFTNRGEGGSVTVERGHLSLEIDGVVITYSPLSLWPNETFHVDADGAQRTAYSLKYTLAELQNGRAADGSDTTDYTVQRLDPSVVLAESHVRCVDTWWRSLGERYLAEELAMIQRIKAAAETRKTVRGAADGE